MKKNKISIITVTKNSEKYLEKNILSVYNQSYKNYEHVIIDGQSTDQTLKIIKKHKKKIHYFFSAKDRSLYDAMNKGIKKCSGDVIGILNSDDVYYKNALKIVNSYFNKYKNLDFLFGSVYKYKLLSGYKPEKIKWSFGFYSTHSVGFFIKRKAQKKVGFYNIKYKYSADYDLFYRLIVKKKMNGMATLKNEIFGKFTRGGLSSRIKFMDYLKECNEIRLDNGQNFLLVYFIFFVRIIKNLKKIFT